MAARSSATPISATASALRAGARSTGTPAAVAASTSTLLGSPRVLATATRGRSNTGPGAAVGLDDEDGGALVGGPLGQLLGVVDAQGLVVDPGVDDEVGELAQQLEPGPADGGRHERLSVIVPMPGLPRPALDEGVVWSIAS